MSLTHFNIPLPTNEPVKSYAPGSPEKAELKKELALKSDQHTEVPVVIGGERIFTGETSFSAVCPHNHQKKLSTVHFADKILLQKAIDTAVKAQKTWAELPLSERAGVFLKAADLLATKYRSAMNVATMIGQSKNIYQSEIDAVAELCDFFRFNAYFAAKILEEQPLYSPPGQWNRMESRGLEGFVFAIGPFNFTSISLNLAAAPALMGCSVLWKPASTAMLSSYLGLQILEEAGLPPGIINLVPASHSAITDVVLKSPDLAGVHFTGSTQTFNSFWQTIGQNIGSYRAYPRLVGETGGKDFIFAHASASVDTLCTALVRGAFEYQGQKCSAASRAFIPKSLWPQLKSQLIDMTQSLKIGTPDDFTNFITAVIDKRAFDKIKSYIEHAKNSPDAEILVGGECDDSTGYFIHPTIIMAKQPRYKTMVEEIFGPVLTLYVYDDNKLEDALTECDEATPYALTGAIFAQDRRVIHQLTERLKYTAGNFYVNDKPTGAVVGQQPFGGARGSGTNDKAGSSFNLMRWINQRTIKENFYSVTDYRYPFMQEP